MSGDNSGFPESVNSGTISASSLVDEELTAANTNVAIEKDLSNFIETERKSYLEKLRVTISSAVSEVDSSLTSLLAYMQKEIEEGSKQLALGEELFFMIGSNSLTEEKWASLIARKQLLTEGRRQALGKKE
jgi:hypothetical protein